MSSWLRPASAGFTHLECVSVLMCHNGGPGTCLQFPLESWLVSSGEWKPEPVSFLHVLRLPWRKIKGKTHLLVTPQAYILQGLPKNKQKQKQKKTFLLHDTFPEPPVKLIILTCVSLIP